DDLHLVGATESLGESAGDLSDRCRQAGPNVNGVVVGAIRRQREKIGLHEIAHVNEVASLGAVFEDDGPLSVTQPRREDGANSRIRVRESLPWPVGIEVAKGDRGNTVRSAYDETHLLLVLLTDRVDGGRTQRFVLVCR